MLLLAPENISWQKKRLKKWFKATEYSEPQDFTWHWHPRVGVFCWSEAKQIGFFFSSGQPLRDKLLNLFFDDQTVNY